MTDNDKPALVENMLLLRREDFDELLNGAAERGAEKVLARLGLENGHAARDFGELRGLLEAWRDARWPASTILAARRQLSWPVGAGKFWCQLLMLMMLSLVSSQGLRASEASLA